MYFSLITPSPGHEREAAHEWASDVYGEHQWLWRFFPSASGTQRDFLYRRRDVEGMPRLYVVSTRKPEPVGAAWSIQTRHYAPVIDTGTRLEFDLRANPVITRRDGGKHRRHDVVMDEKTRLLRERGLDEWSAWAPDNIAPDGCPDPRPPLYDVAHRTCMAWLQSRARNNGFVVDEHCTTVEAYRQHEAKRGQLKFSTVDFRGELQVTDPDAFSHALVRGIGRAKAFGCGLLLVRRL